MSDWLLQTKAHFRNRDFLISFFTAVLFFIVSFGINFVAGTYASKIASNSVTDIILSNIPV